MIVRSTLSALAALTLAGVALADVADPPAPRLDDPADVSRWLTAVQVEPGLAPSPFAKPMTWLRLGADAQGLYFARVPRVRAERIGIATLKVEHFEPAALAVVKAGPVRSQVTQLEFDCQDRESRVASVTAYAGHNARGPKAKAGGLGAWTPMAANPVTRQLGEVVCRAFDGVVRAGRPIPIDNGAHPGDPARILALHPEAGVPLSNGIDVRAGRFPIDLRAPRQRTLPGVEAR